jgi:hypothetical protein
MKKPLFALVILISAVCGHSEVLRNESKNAQPSRELLETCGMTARMPADVFTERQTKLEACIGSYKAPGGTVLSLTPADHSSYDPRWLEQIPMLHVRDISIEN